MPNHQSPISLLRSQFQAVHHGWLEPTMQGVTGEQAHWQPPGRSAPIGAHYAHHIIAVDFLWTGFVRGGVPVGVSSFAGQTGFGEPYPMEGDWDQWARSVRVDLDALRQYAQAVYAAFDVQLSALSDEELATPVDMTPVGLGQQTYASFLPTLLIHAGAHTGEIAAIKGLQDLQGYPF